MNTTAQTAGPLAVFPGQGSQRPGMAEHLVSRHPEIVDPLFARAEAVVDLPLRELCVRGSARELARTEITQPAVLVTDLAVWEVLRRAGRLVPAAFAGHSLGEYAALVAAGVLRFESALLLVRRRGLLMAAAAETVPGTMAAITGLDARCVEQLCRRGSACGVVEAANYNGPGQTVVSGEASAVEEVVRLAGRAGARQAVTLKVSAPFHSSLMKAVEDDFTAELSRHEFLPPRIPVLSSVTGERVAGAEDARALLRRQLSSPVRWTRVLQAGAGCSAQVEVGPGRVLSGFAKAFGADRPVLSTHDARRLATLLAPGTSPVPAA